MNDKALLSKKIRALKLQHPDYGIKRIWEQLRGRCPSLKFSRVKNRVKSLGLVISSPPPKTAPGRFECGLCGKSYTRKNGLARHQRVHSGETPFDCSECGKSFGLKTTLLEHMRVHSGEKPFKCEICARAFKNRSGWKRHVNTHSLEKKFECPIQGCGQKFCRRFSLSQHLRSLQHNGTEAYMCSLCHKVLSSSTKLKHHMWVHRSKKPAPSSAPTATAALAAATGGVRRASALPSVAPVISATAIVPPPRSLATPSASTTSAPFAPTPFATTLSSSSSTSFSSAALWCHSGSLGSSAPYVFEDEEDVSEEEEDEGDDAEEESVRGEDEMDGDYSENPSRTLGKRFACDVFGCGKAFAYQHVLRKHALSHSTATPFLCSRCPRGFKSQLALDCHQRQQHEEGGGPRRERREGRGSKHTLRFLICGGGSMWVCHRCQCAFTRKVDLQGHFGTCEANLQE